ncbi:MAG TPA: 3'-5' exonuclease, partial [Fibrobacteria bacterium]|nr:3'-5' exonuclease [Fibrobacteria bacterium]
DDEMTEASWVSRRILNDEVYGPGGTAIFYRTNAQSRLIEDELRRRQIPYLIVGGTRFYERKEVKDLLAYLRLLANPRDDVSLLRVINVPKRGLGDKSIDQLQDYARGAEIPLFEALPFADQAGIAAAASRRMREFHETMQSLRGFAENRALPDLVNEVLVKSGYKAALENEGTDEAADRLGNLEELVSAAQDFIDRLEDVVEQADDSGIDEALPGTPLELFLQEISLVSDADALKAGQDAVTLMTVHSSKGLEFPRVFVTGMEEGLFPLMREDDPDAEEERRLFYVAVTRARQELSLTFARRRRRYGTYQESMASRFLREIDKQYLDIPRAVAAPKPAFRMGMAVGRALNNPDPMPRYEDMSQEESPFRPGARVRHAKFGEGKVMQLSGSGDSASAVVMFGDKVPRTLMLKFAKLDVLD